ncbi:MAG: sulfatase-like hydrolase/transferase [Verrucomicrobiota bacterium]
MMAVCLLVGVGGGVSGGAAGKTNVVFILTDNHGAWTLGCYGNPDIRTPGIDRMAAEGVLFTNAFCNNAVCSPTRATYLTGLMPSQHGVHNFLSGGRLQTGPEARNTLEDIVSSPEILSEAGYACGLVGKWHLGDNLHPQEGLTARWITMPHGGTSTFHGAKVIENGEERMEPRYLTDVWTENALAFLEAHREEPFFLFLSYNGPYGLSRYQLESSGNAHAAYYADKDMASFPRGAIHPWQYPNREYFGNLTSMRRYGEELSAIDDGVSAVVGKLEELGLDEETLIVFAADQGWAGGQHGVWGMGDHTRPTNAREHSMRIPTIYRHPGGIPGGRESDLMVSNYDFMPTVLGYLGMGEEMPASPKSPGRDYSAVLRGDVIGEWEDAVFYEYEGLRCVRTRDWKYVERYGDGHEELYDLAADPGERVNLAGDEGPKDQEALMKSKLDEFFTAHVVADYDLWNGGGSQTRLHTWGKEAQARQTERATRFARPIPGVIDPSVDVPPMTLPDGLVVEVAAAPPLTRHPMMGAFDDRGRLFVAEAAGVNLKFDELQKELPNFIRMLVDDNGDGLFDRSTIFADKLTFPSGALWHERALWVTSPPSIWRFEDTDDDGVADKREEIVTGFGSTGNAADLHGPFLHPNGRIFWAHGRKDLEVRDREGGLVFEGKGARIWSCEADGSDVQIYAGGGMDNPVEIDFTPEGEIVGTVNLFYGRPRGDVLVHWLPGGVYPRRDQEDVLAGFLPTGDLLPEFHDFGHVGVSGMMRCRTDALVEGMKGDILTAMFNTQRVVRTGMERDGATYRATGDEDFLVIDDPDVHLTDVLEAPDGTLYVMDTGGWFRIGCPTSQIAKPEVAGAIYRIRRAGLYERGGGELGDGEDGVDGVEARAMMVWAAVRGGDGDRVAASLGDEAPVVRQAACNGLGWLEEAGAVEGLVARLADGDAGVQMAAARALGRIGDRRAMGPLLEMLDGGVDRMREHTVIVALREIGDEAGLREALEAAVSGGVLWALEGMGGDVLRVDDIVPFLDGHDEETVAAATAICARHPEWGDVLGRELASWLVEGELGAGREAVLRALAPALLGESVLVEALVPVLRGDAGGLGYELIAMRTEDMPLPAAWEGVFDARLSVDAGEAIDEPVLDALMRVETERYEGALRALAADERQARTVRVKALLAATKGRKGALHPEGFDLLRGMFLESTSSSERVEAAAILSGVSLNAAQRLEVTELVREAGPLELPVLLGVFQRTRDEETGLRLVAALEECEGIGAMAATEVRRLLMRYPASVVEAVGPLVERLMERDEAKARRLEEMSGALDDGDAARGRDVFMAGKGACITCHQIGDAGRAVGPDLSRIGRIRSKRDLLESILYPGASLARDFEAYEIETRDGAVLFGVIERESGEAIHLLDATGVAKVIARGEVAEVRPGAVSLMPAGLEQSMTPEELVDLIAYLKGLE